MSSMEERAGEAGVPIRVFDVEAEGGEGGRFTTDPYGLWDELAEYGPLFYSPAGRGFFVTTDTKMMKSVLQDPVTWSSKPSTMTFTTEPLELHMGLVNDDPPEHPEFRRVLNPLFSPQAVQPLEPRIREIATSLIDAIGSRTECDFFDDFSSKLPALFFLEWLGLSNDDTERMFRLAVQGTSEFSSQEARDAVDNEINGIVSELFSDRREDPRDDLASELLRVRLDGQPLTQKQLVDIGNVTFIAGQETTATTLACAIMHFAQHPDQRQQVIDDPSLIPTALDEIMRVYFTGGPVGRNATKDTEIDGCPIKKGDRIFFARCTADRNAYPDVAIDRWPNPHSAFGLGPHRCLGIHVARLEMQVALEEWHRRVPEYRIADGFEPKYHSGFLQSLTALPLEFSAPPSA